MAIKKSELYSSLWKSCDELRGGMDASQYKDYVLVLLFVKYVSDKYAGEKYASILIPDGGSFKDMVSLKGKKDIGESINKIIAKLAEANELKGVIDVADFDNSDKLGKGKEKVDRLSNLIGIFQNESLDFSKNKSEGDDILGDAYEYLMRHFATESGKSKGQFYTPAEVSRVIAKVIGINQAKSQDQTIYDPTCGSGSLLLKAADEARHGVTIYGQEMDNATAALAKMNMILHGNPTAEIWQDNTLSTPYFQNIDKTLKTFDFAVANPPFSSKAWSNGFDPATDLYERFEDGIPPDKNGDYAFLLHLIRSLKSKGKGAIILPHGVLFRGNVEAEIRKNIIRKGFIRGIIGLPANLFYGTGIPACIVVIDKENADGRKGIFIIDAGKGFIKDGNKNRLREQDIHKIVDVFNKQAEVPKYSRMVSVEEIEQNEYNLNIPRYIDSQEAEDIQDIEAHLLGDIPGQDIDDLDNYWQVYPTLKYALFSTNSREGYVTLTIPQEEIKHIIFSHPEFADYTQKIDTAFKKWKDECIPILKTLDVDTKPKEMIHNLSKSILASFADKDLIDHYDIYQHLMTYWIETMQDDVYMISTDGWKAELSRVN
ncbi:MAG: type I restriction-modification system subunit M [Methanosarcinales archaeon]